MSNIKISFFDALELFGVSSCADFVKYKDDVFMIMDNKEVFSFYKYNDIVNGKAKPDIPDAFVDDLYNFLINGDLVNSYDIDPSIVPVLANSYMGEWKNILVQNNQLIAPLLESIDAWANDRYKAPTTIELNTYIREPISDEEVLYLAAFKQNLV